MNRSNSKINKPLKWKLNSINKYHNSWRMLCTNFDGEIYCCAIFDELTVLYNNLITLRFKHSTSFSQTLNFFENFVLLFHLKFFLSFFHRNAKCIWIINVGQWKVHSVGKNLLRQSFFSLLLIVQIFFVLATLSSLLYIEKQMSKDLYSSK